jgi:hypothetical protein
MNQLERKHHKPDGANKYHINCGELEKNPSSIPIILEKVIKNKNDVTILESIIKDKSIISKQKHIVVKIGKVNKTIEKEYHIGCKLEKNQIYGFIVYMCLFVCFDDTYQKIDMNNSKLSLCSASNETENKKAILVMPFIQESSVKNFNWFNGDKFNILKSIIKQSVISLTLAYNKCGFIHNDLHLDNILLKKTKKQTIEYQMNNNGNNNNNKNENEITIKTFGYKAIIMDFDSSMINIDNKSTNGYEYFWKNIYNMISRLETDLKNKQNESISVSNMKQIVTYILDQKSINIFKLLEMINMMQFTVLEPPKTLYKYDPRVF